MNSTRIADELAIHNLVSRYSDAVVRRASAEWGDTWSLDAQWHVFGKEIRGRAAIVSHWEGFLSRLPFVHQQSTGGLIAFTDDVTRATGRWYVTEWGVSGNGPGLLTLGVYHDDYVREPVGPDEADEACWRFQCRRFDPLYMGPPDLSGHPQPFPKDV